MKYLYLILFSYSCLQLHAQERITEHGYVYLDKDCYVAGEEMHVRFSITDSHFIYSNLSKVGYIEICDTQKPWIQHKIAIQGGMGASKISIPTDIPTGIYQLNGYTRYMRNQGVASFFKRHVSIINVLQSSENDRVNLITSKDKIKGQSGLKKETNILVSSNRSGYSTREQGQLMIQNLPKSVTNLTISIHRNDSLQELDYANPDAWKRQVDAATSLTGILQWPPEYEGHIITGQTVSGEEEGNIDYSKLSADMGFVSKNIRYIRGQMKTNDGQALFYTKDIFGSQDVVITALSADEDKTHRMDIISPFCEQLPTTLPILKLRPENNALMERGIAVQLNQIKGLDSLDTKIPLDDYYHFRSKSHYDLDEYTRFNTVNETLIEFVKRVHVRKIGGKKRLKVLLEEQSRYNTGNTLVLLDGVPVHNHEDIIEYNAHLLKSIDIYSGRYIFGGEIFECMVVFNSHRGDFPGIQLTDRSQMIAYEFPQLYTKPEYPVYNTEESRKSRKPDFRHTLFWEPFAEKRDDLASGIYFYTSDLCGEFKVVVEGITSEGEFIYGETSFMVQSE